MFLFPVDVASVVRESVTKPSLRFAYVDKIGTFAATQSINDIGSFTVKWGCDFPRFSSTVTLMACGPLALDTSIAWPWARGEAIFSSSRLSVLQLSSHQNIPDVLGPLVGNQKWPRKGLL